MRDQLRQLRRDTWLPLLAAGVLAAGCGPSETASPVDGKTNEAPTTGEGDCAAPQVALPDGSCIRPGIGPDGCSAGFEHDGEYGCEPILPEGDCAPGMMAVPGDEACQPVMPCGAGLWGDLPVDASTQYVDGSYAKGNSDGSSERPWTTIGRAYQAASPSGLIAVAAGNYPEQLLIGGKSIRLWGVCPEKVSVVGTGVGNTFFLTSGSDGSEIGGIAITGAALGIGILGVRDVTLDRVWLHDTASVALAVQGDLAPASAQMIDSLIEGAHTFGIFVGGGQLSLARSVVRNTLPDPADQSLGLGLFARPICDTQGCAAATHPEVTIEGCRIDGNRTQGIDIAGGKLTMKATVVRNTLPQASDQRLGEGLLLELACDELGRCDGSHPTQASIHGSFIDNNHTHGLLVSASHVELVDTVVRGTQPAARDKNRGMGLAIQGLCDATSCDPAAAGLATIRNSLFEKNHGAALLAAGSTVTVARTVARHTLPRQRDLRFGSGIVTQLACDIQSRCYPDIGGTFELVESLLSDNHAAGVMTVGSRARLNSSVIRQTAPQQVDGLYGDGVVLMSLLGAGSANIDALSIQDSARAGLANFGAEIQLTGSRIQCATFELVGQNLEDRPYVFEDGGDNVCGCPEPAEACKAVSADLEPPEMLQ